MDGEGDLCCVNGGIGFGGSHYVERMGFRKMVDLDEKKKWTYLNG